MEPAAEPLLSGSEAPPSPPIAQPVDPGRTLAGECMGGRGRLTYNTVAESHSGSMCTSILAIALLVCAGLYTANLCDGPFPGPENDGSKNGPLPAGSYRSTCQDCVYQPPTLSCGQCQQSGGGWWYDPSLDVSTCAPPIEVGNNDGILVCSSENAPTSAPVVPTAAPLPAGSYTNTCGACTYVAPLLACENCKQSGGGTSFLPELNVSTCPAPIEVANSDGNLVCAGSSALLVVDAVRSRLRGATAAHLATAVHLANAGTYNGKKVCEALGGGEGGKMSVGWWWGVFAIAYFMYWCEIIFNSSTIHYLAHVNSQKGTEVHQHALKRRRPKITMKVECYHMERRTSTTTDSNGNTTTNTYYVKVVTFRGSRAKTFRSWADVSAPLADINVMGTPVKDPQKTERRSCCRRPSGIRIMKITQVLKVEPFDSETRDHLAQEAALYRLENVGRDARMDFKEEYDLQGGYEKKVMTINGSKPFMLQQSVFILASLLLMTWPYRLWLESVSFRATWELKKILAMRNLSEVARQAAAKTVIPTAQPVAGAPPLAAGSADGSPSAPPLTQILAQGAGNYYSPFDPSIPIAVPAAVAEDTGAEEEEGEEDLMKQDIKCV